VSKNNWIPISEISDDTQIWSGTIVRVFGVNNCKEDFYDYIVSFIYDILTITINLSYTRRRWEYPLCIENRTKF